MAYTMKEFAELDLHALEQAKLRRAGHFWAAGVTVLRVLDRYAPGGNRVAYWADQMTRVNVLLSPPARVPQEPPVRLSPFLLASTS